LIRGGGHARHASDAVRSGGGWGIGGGRVRGEARAEPSRVGRRTWCGGRSWRTRASGAGGVKSGGRTIGAGQGVVGGGGGGGGGGGTKNKNPLSPAGRSAARGSGPGLALSGGRAGTTRSVRGRRLGSGGGRGGGGRRTDTRSTPATTTTPRLMHTAPHKAAARPPCSGGCHGRITTQAQKEERSRYRLGRSGLLAVATPAPAASSCPSRHIERTTLFVFVDYLAGSSVVWRCFLFRRRGTTRRRGLCLL